MVAAERAQEAGLEPEYRTQECGFSSQEDGKPLKDFCGEVVGSDVWFRKLTLAVE